jgi:DNA-binding response OmpR family regulator
MRVLVYETTPDRAKLIQELLNTYRYKTYVNHDPSPSLDPLNDLKPTLLIVNVNHKAHLELLEKLRAHPQYNRIPVILLSNMNSFDAIHKFHQLPHVDYLVEPFKIKSFRHIVERWINFKSLYVN